jgi:hypothetical protein
MFFFPESDYVFSHVKSVIISNFTKSYSLKTAGEDCFCLFEDNQ